MSYDIQTNTFIYLFKVNFQGMFNDWRWGP